MIRFTEPLAFAAPPPIVPGRAIPHGPVATTTEAAFLAGAALNCLDNLVRSAPPWSGAWRQRLALKAAGSAAARMRQRSAMPGICARRAAIRAPRAAFSRLGGGWPSGRPI